LASDYECLGRALDAVLASVRWVAEHANSGQLLKVSQFCTRILQMFGDLLAAWGLLEAAAAANGRLRELAIDDPARPFYRGKIKTMRFFMTNLLPRLFSNSEILAGSGAAYTHVDDAE